MRADSLWPGHPRLEPAESFSSWFARTAAANGLRPGELYRILQPGEDRDPRDLDRYADVHLIDRVAECTGVDAGKLAHATFQHWAGSLFDHDDGAHKLAWLPPAGRVNGKRCYGQQFCPLCLAGDREPHLRRTWRLAFVTVCPLHGSLLLDRCGRCGEPFNVLRQDSRGRMTCWSCGADISQFDSKPAVVDALAVQRDLLEMMTQGWWTMGEYGPVYSIAVFQILASLTRILASGRYAHALRAWVASREQRLAVPPETVPRAREGALLGTRARSVLVPMAHWLMVDWPLRFAAAAHDVGITSRDLLKRAEEQYPFAYAHAVEWFLKEPFGRCVGDEEVIAAKAVLGRRGVPASRRNLAELFGCKVGAVTKLADPVAEGAPWGLGRYWKLDGVSPEVKAAARGAAHRAGEGVGPWLDAVLRRELNLPALKSPYGCRVPDTFARDSLSGCDE